jgi:hypothetical protein
MLSLERSKGCDREGVPKEHVEQVKAREQAAGASVKQSIDELKTDWGPARGGGRSTQYSGLMRRAQPFGQRFTFR